MSSSASARSLWWISTPFTLASTGSAAGAWALAKPAASRAAAPVAARAGRERDATADGTMARKLGREIMGIILIGWLATDRSAEAAHTRAIGHDWQPQLVFYGPTRARLRQIAARPD